MRFLHHSGTLAAVSVVLSRQIQPVFGQFSTMAVDLDLQKLGFTRFRKQVARFAAAALVGLALGAGAAAKQAPNDVVVSSATVALGQLPREGQATYRLIRQGGPFRYSKDGSTFGNRERLLPSKPRGYYREYTVDTPGSRDRGARRIVCGGSAPTAPEACFYTDDHYGSFRRIVE